MNNNESQVSLGENSLVKPASTKPMIGGAIKKKETKPYSFQPAGSTFGVGGIGTGLVGGTAPQSSIPTIPVGNSRPRTLIGQNQNFKATTDKKTTLSPAPEHEEISDENSVNDGSYIDNQHGGDDYENDWKDESLKEIVTDTVPSARNFKLNLLT